MDVSTFPTILEFRPQKDVTKFYFFKNLNKLQYRKMDRTVECYNNTKMHIKPFNINCSIQLTILAFYMSNVRIENLSNQNKQLCT